MRRNGTNPNFGALDPALLAWQDDAPPFKPVRPVSGGLTPAQQRQQAILIARSFKGQYLSGIAYLEDYETTIAIVRPIHRDKANSPHQISVDPAGNISVTRLAPPAPAEARRVARRLLLAAAACIPLLILMLIAIS